MRLSPCLPGKPHRGGTVRHCRPIKGHDDVDRMGEADTSPCFLSRGSSRLPRYLPFYLLFLFAYLLFPTLVLILLAFVSHCVPPFPVIPHLLVARVPLRQFCLCGLSGAPRVGPRHTSRICLSQRQSTYENELPAKYLLASPRPTCIGQVNRGHSVQPLL